MSLVSLLAPLIIINSSGFSLPPGLEYCQKQILVLMQEQLI